MSPLLVDREIILGVHKWSEYLEIYMLKSSMKQRNQIQIHILDKLGFAQF